MIKSVQQAYQNRQYISCQSIRDQKVVQIRKAKRQERFQLRRKVKSYESTVKSDTPIDNCSKRDGKMIVDPQMETELRQFIQQKYTIEMLPYLSRCLKSDNIIEVHLGAIGIRNILLPQNPPVNEVLSLQIYDSLLKLSGLHYPHLQHQIAWCLNILSYEMSDLSRLTENGIVDILLNLLISDSPQTVELVIITVGNTCCDSLRIREEFLQKNYINCIQKYIFERFNHQRISQMACYGIAIFCLGQQLVREELIDNGIKILSYMLEEDVVCDDLQILQMCILAIFNHCQRIIQKEKRQQILRNEFLTVIIRNLQHQDKKFAKKIAKYIGNYIANVPQAANMFISVNILEVINNCLYSDCSFIKRQACWILSNLAVDSSQQILQFRQQDKQIIICRLADMLFEDNLDVKKEIFFVFAHITQGRGNFLFEQFLRQYDVIAQMVQIMKQDSDQLVASIIKNLYIFLKQAQKFQKQDIIINQLEKDNNLTVIENLQIRESDEIYKYASKILSKYFRCDKILISTKTL